MLSKLKAQNHQPPKLTQKEKNEQAVEKKTKHMVKE